MCWTIGAPWLQVASSIPVVVAPPPQAANADDFTSIPTTIPSNCSSDAPASLPNQWDSGACLTGLNANKWDFDTNGTQLPPDPTRCMSPSGSSSCGRRSAGAWSNPHLMFEPQGSPSDLLVVYLPGTGGAALSVTRLLRSASRVGHRVLGLSYMSQPFSSAQANRWCEPTSPNGKGTAGECNSELHQQLLFGTVSPELQGKSENVWPVPQEDSVEALVKAVLMDQAWGSAFLQGGEVDWTKIIISGHSQGASHAAYLTQVKKTHAVLFSGPQDSPASAENWGNLSVPATVHRRALSHLHEECGDEPLHPDTYCETGQLPKFLQDMGLGNYTVWAGGALPSSLTNVVTSVMPKSCGGRRIYHRSVVLDECAPDEYDALWEAMFKGIGALPSPSPPDSHASRTCVSVLACALATLLMSRASFPTPLW